MAELMNQFEGIKLFRVLLRLLTQGKPVEMTQIAEAADLPVEEVKRLFKSLPKQELDDAGRLIGFGLTLQATPHRFIIGGRTLYIWCPTNALLFPIALGQPARLESNCYATGRPVTIDVTPTHLERVVPDTAVIGEVVPPEVAAAPKTSDFDCDKEQLFSSAEAAVGWLAEHPGAHIYPVAEELDRCQWLAAAIGWK